MHLRPETLNITVAPVNGAISLLLDVDEKLYEGIPKSATPPGTTAARVTRIVDGDTIDVLLNDQTVRVRYILMNTPETGQPFGAEATAKNRELVDGKTVYLEKDVSETDRFDRLLRYVYLADGTMVNRELVRLGYAQVSTYPPDVKCTILI